MHTPMPSAPTNPPILTPCTIHAHHIHHPCTFLAPSTHSPCTPRARNLLRTCHAPGSPPGSQLVGEEARVEFPRARLHRRRRRLLRRLHSEHHEALRGEQAGGGRPPRRLPAAVAAGAPGLQLQRGPLDEAARRRLHPALGNWQREQLRVLRLNGACHRDARRSPDRTPR